MTRALVVIALVVACGACGKKDDKPTSPRDQIIEAWKGAGLQPSTFVTATVPVGSDCASGMVGGLDVLACVYPTATAAQAAEEPGRGWVGLVTGAAQAKGTVLVAVADRKKVDPTGKLINQLMKLAAATAAPAAETKK